MKHAKAKLVLLAIFCVTLALLVGGGGGGHYI